MVFLALMIGIVAKERDMHETLRLFFYFFIFLHYLLHMFDTFVLQRI